MKSLTQMCENFRLRKEKQRLEEFIENNSGLVYMCGTPSDPPWGRNYKPEEVSLTQSSYGNIGKFEEETNSIQNNFKSEVPDHAEGTLGPEDIKAGNFPSFGNWSHNLNQLKETIPELQNWDVNERYDFSGHISGKKGPHVSYDFKNESREGPIFKVPFGKKDSFGLGDIPKEIIDEWRKKNGYDEWGRKK